MSSGKVIVYGGKGALGSAILDFFKKNGYTVLNIDLSANDQADSNILVDGNKNWVEQEQSILEQAASSLQGSQVDGVFCVAGGWAGGSASSKDFVKNADLMIKQSVWSSAIAAKLATTHLKPGGLLQLTGAAAAVGPTPGMIGYGMAKAAVHHLATSLAEKDSGLPENSSVLTILPVTLDTEMNRKWMPKADHSSWTPLSFISESLLKWTTESSSRPTSGALLKITTANGESTITPQ
ncbi:CBN-QDPR-1 protein [Caenorhabditis brenneri]|uniref:Dihydropteridine reductase n=1 Tax=Caenorhabditis brenneri TaxID=135651 RepID=G0N4S7_CAEBE|nr:CBN-QDPR-1 protein [Caenorhabditis brenneri]